jgi:hypothetical protein
LNFLLLKFVTSQIVAQSHIVATGTSLDNIALSLGVTICTTDRRLYLPSIDIHIDQTS